jgi:5-(hydroxymethyl)furfural/furfural oxidase
VPLTGEDGGASHVIVGGGSAGCVIASRLSEDPQSRVVLIEAGQDYLPDTNPADVLDTYAGRAMSNPDYFWQELRASRGAGNPIPPRAQSHEFYHQAKLIGGGSAINAQIALRGTNQDYQQWVGAGAKGWGWEDVLPYFRKLERDLDFEGPLHGTSGPLPITRVKREAWDPFTKMVGVAWERKGYRYLTDMNTEFEDGFASVPFSNDGKSRWSAARAYLTTTVRQRSNLVIRCRTHVNRILHEGNRARGVEWVCEGRQGKTYADNVILAAGALRTPQILMLSGIGPGSHLNDMGIPVVSEVPGVGGNLQDHPSIYVSAYLRPSARRTSAFRGAAAYLRYSSKAAGCPDSDMTMIAVARSGWHAIGAQIASMVAFIGVPFSRGSVRLRSPKWSDTPHVVFNYLADDRDRVRMVSGFRSCAETLLREPVAAISRDAFPSTYSKRVARISRPTVGNVFMTRMGSIVMDVPLLRTPMIKHVVTEAPGLNYLLSNENALEDYVCGAVSTIWHPCGTCKMGDAQDASAVTDLTGRVRGIERLVIADASLMPLVPRTNTNIPTIMVAERIADALRERGV